VTTTIYSSQVSYGSWAFSLHGSTIYESGVLSTYPYPRPENVPIQYQNKVWDTIAGQWIYWNTQTPDYGGQQYPGPGNFGTETSGYGVEALVLGRYQKV